MAVWLALAVLLASRPAATPRTLGARASSGQVGVGYTSRRPRTRHAALLCDGGGRVAAASVADVLRAAGVDAARVLEAAPELQQLNVRDVRDSLDFVERYVGGARLPQFVLKHPYALHWAAGAIEKLLSDELGCGPAEISRLLRGANFLLAPAATDAALEVVRFLRDELELGAERTRAAVLRFPRVLTLPVSRAHAGGAQAAARGGGGGAGAGAQPVGSTLRERVAFLRDAGLTDRGALARALCRHPQLLGLDVAANLRPTCAFYAALGVRVERLLCAHPQALSLSLEANVAPKVAFWTSVGVPDVGALVSAHPVVLSLSLAANLEPKTRYLQGLGIGGLGRALQAYPQVYTLSLAANIAPTVEFLRRCGYDVGKELRLRHLAASLPKRIVPRYELWRRTPPRVASWRPSIPELCVLGTAAFCARLGVEQSALAELERAIGPVVRELAKVDPDALVQAFAHEEPEWEWEGDGRSARAPPSEQGAPS